MKYDDVHSLLFNEQLVTLEMQLLHSVTLRSSMSSDAGRGSCADS